LEEVLMAGSSAGAAKRRRRPGRPFEPGQSGNPGGRAKRTQEELDLIEACKGKSTAALGVIEQIMLNGESERNRLAAAQYIVDRAYGKAVQQTELTGKGGEPFTIQIVRFGDVNDER
jgi:hypothetical protein